MQAPDSTSAAALSTESRLIRFVWLLVAASLILGAMLVSTMKEGIGDEAVHAFQVTWLVEGTYKIFESVTMLPVYHGMVAVLMKMSGATATSLPAMRIAHVILAACCLPVFYRLCAALRPHTPAQDMERTLQFLYLPILFPLFFLIYTDIPALTFVLALIERTCKRRYYQAALCGFFAVGLRQPNLVWVAYACALIVLNDEHSLVSWPAWRERLQQSWQKLLPFGAVFIAFGLFVWINGGVAVGDAQQHHIGFNLSNLYFLLIVCFFAFLPFNLASAADIQEYLRDRKWLAVPIALGGALYWVTYAHPHMYNTTELSFYRHNLILHYTCDIAWVKSLAYIAIVWMSLSFVVAARQSSQKRAILLLAPFAAISVVPLPLIEQRYYLVAMSLFLAMRNARSEKTEWLGLAYSISISAYFIYNISQFNFTL